MTELSTETQNKLNQLKKLRELKDQVIKKHEADTRRLDIMKDLEVDRIDRNIRKIKLEISPDFVEDLEEAV